MDMSSSSSSSPSVSARIRASATGLLKDLLSSSINGSGALETTNELAALGGDHKIPPALSYGVTSSPRTSKSSSKHRSYGDEFTQYSKKWFGLDAADANDDLSHFMLEDSNMAETSAPSSRSGSTLDLALSARDSPERWAGVHLERNDSFNPELFPQQSKAKVTYADGDSSRLHIHLEETTHELDSPSDHLAQSLSWANHTKTSSVSLRKTISPNSIHGADSIRRKERALSRLQLIFSQMPVVAQLDTSSALARIDWSESSYNQFCGGEDAQAWAEFEVSLIHGSNARGLEHDMVRDLATGLNYAQGPQSKRASTSAFSASKQGHLQANLYNSNVLRDPQQSRNTESSQQQQAPEREEYRSKGKDTIETFHCPWIDCHSMCADYLRDTDGTDSLPCVHRGCELEFVTEEVWRKHVSIAHHDLLRRQRPTDEADLEAAWEKLRT
ncbi:hypothetical protein E4T39_00964 [Aureobasidium subglaciale]|nr:hypothetical protein E4T39_00964 [Aureobasidium subglaciale]